MSFVFNTKETIKLKKTFEVLKDVFMDVYLKADFDRLIFIAKSPKISNPYFLILELSDNASYSFKDVGFEKEYSRIFETEQLYKCIKSMAHLPYIEIRNDIIDDQGIIVENSDKRVMNRIKFLNRAVISPFDATMTFDTSKIFMTYTINAKEYTQIIKNMKTFDFQNMTFELDCDSLKIHSKNNIQEYCQVIDGHAEYIIKQEDLDTVVVQNHLVANLMFFIKSVNLNKIMTLKFSTDSLFIEFQIPNIGSITFLANVLTK